SCWFRPERGSVAPSAVRDLLVTGENLLPQRVQHTVLLRLIPHRAGLILRCGLRQLLPKLGDKHLRHLLPRGAPRAGVTGLREGATHSGCFRVLQGAGFVSHAGAVDLEGVPHPGGALAVRLVHLGSYDPAGFALLPVMGEQLRLNTPGGVIPVETLDT